MNDVETEMHDLLDRAYPPSSETEDWDDVLARLRPTPARRRYRLIAVATALAVAATIALVVTSPWQGGPTILDKASAALAAPAGQVIYESTRFPATGSLCVVSTTPWMRKHGCPAYVSRTQLWVEGGTSGARTFRAVTSAELPKKAVGAPASLAPFGSALVRIPSRHLVIETGGTIVGAHVRDVLVRLNGQDVITKYTQAPTAVAATTFDPVELIRNAFRRGHAQLEGATMLRGRKVERIAVELASDGEQQAATYYVDASSFEPVEIVFRKGAPGFPFGAPFGTLSTHATLLFTAFRYLPATKMTLRETSLPAQHPHLKIVCGVEFGLPDC
jgi:hypothetical protein